jgi:hypothetical protein
MNLKRAFSGIKMAIQRTWDKQPRQEPNDFSCPDTRGAQPTDATQPPDATKPANSES